MGFDVAASAYDRFMGRFSEPLADGFADFAGVGAGTGASAGQRALDVGCGPGALTARLVDRLGAENVRAIDPSRSFVEAARERFPGLEIRRASAELIPYPEESFDRTLAQLVVRFMRDPVEGVREMARVTRPGGVVAACLWDQAASGPLTVFWQAARDVDPSAAAGDPGATDGDYLPGLFGTAGLPDPESAVLEVSVGFASFADWWEPFALGVGPAGDHLAALDDDARAAVRARCAELLPTAPFTLTVTARATRATV